MKTSIDHRNTPAAATEPQTPPQLKRCLERALAWLLEEQNDEGFWVGILESNVCIEAQWLLAFHVLGIKNHPLQDGLIKSILAGQRDDGSWQIYFDAPHGDINATVESYTALRAYGLPSDHPQLALARNWIFANGGLSQVRVFTRYWLALIGEWPWQKTPSLPPEIIYFPRWFPFNIYHFASWARATIVPLCILSLRQTSVPLAPEALLDELFPEGRDTFNYELPEKPGLWAKCFVLADKALKFYRRILPRPPLQENAVRCCLEWIVKHQDADGAWGGIQAPWIYSLVALHTEGYSLSHPMLAKGIDTLDDYWSYQRGESTHIQSCESPVWDTLLSLMALLDCDLRADQVPAMQRAIDWVIGQQVRTTGDWQLGMPEVAPGGWAFERANTYYPDVDDTAVALIVLARAKAHYHKPQAIEQAIDLGTQWVLAMQCSNGGWAAFDKDNHKAILTKIPFSDYGETIDPPSVDVTAHVLEALGHIGFTNKHPAVRRALDYIWSEQEASGSWFGRWGVNHIYGTAAVLPALQVLGEDMTDERVLRAAQWIVDHQNDDGGWGESCASYMDESLQGRGPSTASQTSWALMCLITVSASEYAESIQRGLHYLQSTQKTNGSWDEPYFTGTGFPGYGVGKRINIDTTSSTELQQDKELGRGFMINYNLYRHYFPLMVLGRARKLFNDLEQPLKSENN